MRCLVTGSRGFIGSHVARTLRERGHEVRDFDLPECDLLDPAAVARGCEGIDAIFHLAAIPKDHGPPGPILRVNAGGTRALLGAAAARGCRRFLLVSTLAVHRNRGYRRGDETAPRDAWDLPYSRSKILAEDAVRASGLPWTIVRPGVFPFGPGDRTSFLPLARALERGRYGYVDGGRALLGTAYVENLALGMALAAESPRGAGEVFVIGDDAPVTWREISERLADAIGAPRPRLSLPGGLAALVAAACEALLRDPPLTRYRVQLVRRDFFFTNQKAKRLLGFEPAVGLDEAVARTAAWYRSAAGPFPVTPQS